MIKRQKKCTFFFSTVLQWILGGVDWSRPSYQSVSVIMQQVTTEQIEVQNRSERKKCDRVLLRNF